MFGAACFGFGKQFEGRHRTKMRRHIGMTLAAAVCAAPLAGPFGAQAEGLSGTARDFTFKRISVADTKPGKRITVQIDPVEQAEVESSRRSGRTFPGGLQRFDQFREP